MPDTDDEGSVADNASDAGGGAAAGMNVRGSDEGFKVCFDACFFEGSSPLLFEKIVDTHSCTRRKERTLTPSQSDQP